jgi:hypothetical protein
VAVTPEGKIKKLVKSMLQEFHAPVQVDGFSVSELYEWWPVPGGFGSSSLDCIIGYRGCMIAVETKAPGEKPTPRQNFTIAQIKGAGCISFVVDSEQSCLLLRDVLRELKNADDS